ncbi:hypothetical protein ACHWQZ_G002291 [Mnemiopsis leidyi]
MHRFYPIFWRLGKDVDYRMAYEEVRNSTSHYPNRPNVVTVTMMSGLLMIFFIVGLLGNNLMVLAFLLKRLMRCVSTFLIYNLAIVDLLVCCCTMSTSFLMIVNSNWTPSPFICQTIGSVDNLALSVSLWFLTLCSFDRYILISKPYQYRNIMSLRKVKMVVPFVWLLCFLLVLPPFFGWSRYGLSQPIYTCALLFVDQTDKYYILFYSLITFPLPIVLIVFCYASITLNVTRHFKRRNKFSKALDDSKSHSHPSNDHMTGEIRRVGKVKTAAAIQKKEQIKVAISILVVIMTLIVTVFPMFCISLVVLFGSGTFHPSFRYVVAAHWVNVGRSSANPLIFGIANKPIREAYRKMMMMVLCRCKWVRKKKGAMSTAADATMHGTHGPRNETFTYRKNSASQVGKRKTCSKSNLRFENETPRGRLSQTHDNAFKD